MKGKGDRFLDTQSKMHEYLKCGVKLGWLIYSDETKVEIYCLGKDVEILHSPSKLLGEDLMLGLVNELD